MQGFLDWIGQLPVVALYAALWLAAMFENVFPPLPADTVVAFGSFLAARGHGTVVAAFLATWSGNVIGAALMYVMGRHYGAARIERRMRGRQGSGADQRLRILYGRYGLGALFVSRFLPGVRAFVPPFAGALRIPPGRAIAVMALASALWYGVITWLAFSVGTSWDRLTERVADVNRSVAIAAVVIAAFALGVWLVMRQRARHG